MPTTFQFPVCGDHGHNLLRIYHLSSWCLKLKFGAIITTLIFMFASCNGLAASLMAVLDFSSEESEPTIRRTSSFSFPGNLDLEKMSRACFSALGMFFSVLSLSASVTNVSKSVSLKVAMMSVFSHTLQLRFVHEEMFWFLWTKYWRRSSPSRKPLGSRHWRSPSGTIRLGLSSSEQEQLNKKCSKFVHFIVL